MSQVADDLNAAADLLERDGWCKSEWQAPDGSRCVLGALSHATQGDSRYSRFVAACLRLDQTVGSPSLWNDQFLQTRRRVVRTLRRIAKDAS